MSLGMILLVVLALLILFGVLQRVLDRMALTDRQALLLVALIFVGAWLPDTWCLAGPHSGPRGACAFRRLRLSVFSRRHRQGANPLSGRVGADRRGD